MSVKFNETMQWFYKRPWCTSRVNCYIAIVNLPNANGWHISILHPLSTWVGGAKPLTVAMWRCVALYLLQWPIRIYIHQHLEKHFIEAKKQAFA